jgi:hypothetical protein
VNRQYTISCLAYPSKSSGLMPVAEAMISHEMPCSRIFAAASSLEARAPRSNLPFGQAQGIALYDP